MAVSLFRREVSDLCIGKPPALTLQASATVAEALASLRSSGHHCASLSSAAGKICVADLLCFLCSDCALADPSAAIRSPLAAILPPDSPVRVRRVDHGLSVLEALDLINEGAQDLLVPISGHSKKKSQVKQFCCLTQEDFLRFFLNYVGIFSTLTALSINSLGIVCPDVLTVGYHEPAISAVPLIKQAAAKQTAIAVVEDGKLVGEISPTTIAFCYGSSHESLAAAMAVLSVGELMAYIDCGGPPEESVKLVKARLMQKGLKGMLELVEKEEMEYSSVFSSSSWSSSAESSSSSEDDSFASELANQRSSGAASRRKCTRSSSYSARMSRRSEEAIVCHPENTLMVAMMQAVAHRVSYIWVVKDDYELAGIVTLPDILGIFRDCLLLQ